MYEQLYGFMQGESFSCGTGYAAHAKPFWIFRKVYGLEKYLPPPIFRIALLATGAVVYIFSAICGNIPL